jgi:Fur family transcriptional regulator, ferric uptake regulator
MTARTRPLRNDDLRDLLARCELRATEPRVAILRELAKGRIPLSHAELSERLTGPGLDKVTIYRNLLSMTEAGLLVKTHLDDNVWRFEFPRSHSTGHGSHPHFICSECGQVACLPANSVSIRGEASRNQVVEVQLRGLCANCARG